MPTPNKVYVVCDSDDRAGTFEVYHSQTWADKAARLMEVECEDAKIQVHEFQYDMTPEGVAKLIGEIIAEFC